MHTTQHEGGRRTCRAHQLRVHERPRVVRAIDTVIRRLACHGVREDRLLTSLHRTWNSNSPLGPSWSVRLPAAPRSVGPRFYWAYRPTRNALWSLLQCAAPGRSSQAGTHGFPGLTANPHHTLVPPGVCGSWPLLAGWDPSQAYRQSQLTFRLLKLGKGIVAQRKPLDQIRAA